MELIRFLIAAAVWSWPYPVRLLFAACCGAAMIIAIHIIIDQPNAPEGVEPDALMVAVYNEPGVLEDLAEQLQKMNPQIRHCHINKRKTMWSACVSGWHSRRTTAKNLT